MFDLIAYSALSTIIIVLSFVTVSIGRKKSLLSGRLSQIEVEQQALKNEISRLIVEQQTAKSDGFIKFISQSRDWAFGYIEEVQDALKKFDAVAGPNLEYARTYGKVAGDTPSTIILDKIDAAYSELIKVLPKDS